MGERLPLQETSFTYLSQRSLDEFSNKSDYKQKGGCDSCLTRIPYATLIATIMCALGVVVFCFTMYRGATLAILMFDQVFKMRLIWIEAVQMAFVVIAACMSALGLMILTVGFLATGATRREVYKAWRPRVGGRISCAIFMGITYVLEVAWILMFCFLTIVTFVFTIFWKMCENPNVEQHGLDFVQFSFLFPEGTREEHMKVMGENDVKLFCKDYIEKTVVMFILATVACIMIILSMIHYLMCLAANYAHIRDHEKLQELQDLQCLNDPDVFAGKDRF